MIQHPHSAVSSRHRLFPSWVLLLALIGLFLACACAWAGERTQPIATRHLPAIVAAGHAMGTGQPPASQRLGLAIALPLRNTSELTTLLHDLGDPASRHYRHYLTVAEFTERFGPSEADYAQLIAFARAHGLRLTATTPNRMLINVEGKVADIERAFHLKLRLYRHPTEQRSFYAPDREPSATGAPPLWHVTGLDNFSVPRPSLAQAPLPTGPVPVTGSGPGGAYLASDMRAAYYGGSALTGAGQSVAVFEFGGYWSGDVENYYSSTGQTNAVPINNVLLEGQSNCSSACEDAEQVVDIVQAIGMAPGLAQLLVYNGNDDPTIFNRIATDDLALQISVSWYWTPADPTSDDPIFQELAAQGQSVFVASGDCGSYTPNVMNFCPGGDGSGPALFPAEDPYITAVGGTALTTSGSGGGFASETAWSGSGGGYADNMPLPDYQNGIANNRNNASTSLRNVPDIAADAIPDSYYCASGACDPGGYVIGGTSLAAPRWAGFVALANEQAAQNRLPPVGFLNPAIYRIGSSNVYGQDLHDTVSGTNGAFPAVTGYDLATGWGSPYGQALIDALAGGLPLTPSVSLLGPASGPVTGGTLVTITGTNLNGATGVNFGASPAANFTLINAGEITATAPPGSFGTVDVTVITPIGISVTGPTDHFIYLPATPVLPVITSLGTASGPVGGGTAVTINGANLAGVTGVNFGTGAAAGFTLVTASQITATTPAAAPGTVDVTVASAGGTSVPSPADQFSFVETGTAPSVGAVFPSSGSTSGGTLVTITGTNLGSTTNVAFGSAPASFFVVDSATKIQATAPSGDAGTVDITITGPAGTSATGPADQYSFILSPLFPAVTGVSPTSGPIGGGNSVTITGISLTGATGVSFGGTPAASYQVKSNTQIVATVPPGLPGVADITVATYIGASATVPTDRYAYEVTAAPQLLTLAVGKGGFNLPAGLALDAAGDVFVADTKNNLVKEIFAAGGYSTVTPIGSGFNQPFGVAVDDSGNVFVADTFNNAVKEILAAGDYNTVISLAQASGHFSFPTGVALDRAGNLFVADWGNSAVKEVLVAGGYTSVETLAAAAGDFRDPAAVALDGAGNLFVADTGNNAIKELTKAGGYASAVTLAAGNFAAPSALALDSTGNIFVADTRNDAVKELLRLGNYSAVYILAPGAFAAPAGVAVDPAGNLFVSDTDHDAVKELLLAPTVSSPLGAAILPGARSVQEGGEATVFATMANGSAVPVTGCGALLPATAPAGLTLSFQTTDPVTNGLTGAMNQPAQIPANGAQSFLLALQSSTPLSAPGLAPIFTCLGTAPAPTVAGVSTVDLTVSATPIADVIALAATATNDGTVHLSSGSGAFAVASVNAGAETVLSIEADTGDAALPLSVTLCQTGQGALCLATPTPSLSLDFTAGATPTFSLFVSATGAIPFDPASSRIFVRFLDTSGQGHGSTSVAVTTD